MKLKIAIATLMTLSLLPAAAPGLDLVLDLAQVWPN